ncbi:hypothetical protein B0J17DRAFT_682823 [Rhizoctonia solani]|nr:hypothetical protein B0J17DRAFT_682823 [Rhizoctonia solani]
MSMALSKWIAHRIEPKDLLELYIYSCHRHSFAGTACQFVWLGHCGYAVKIERCVSAISASREVSIEVRCPEMLFGMVPAICGIRNYKSIILYVCTWILIQEGIYSIVPYISLIERKGRITTGQNQSRLVFLQASGSVGIVTNGIIELCVASGY